MTRSRITFLHYRLYTFLVLHLLWLTAAASSSGLTGGNQPFCDVRLYDEYDGLSQRLVKQVTQTDDGLIWIATWNGLNRFDGQRFAQIRLAADDVARRYSQRFGDIRVNATGDLWCKVDDRLLRFDVRNYRFNDVTPALEASVGRRVSVRNLWPTCDGQTLVECSDSGYVLFTDTLSGLDARYHTQRPSVRFLTSGNKQASVMRTCPYTDLIYARADSVGGRWVITAQGAVCYAAPGSEDWATVSRVEAPQGTLRYCMTDCCGRVWLCSTVGAFCLTLGTYPYQMLRPEHPSRVRQMHRDAAGRLWLSESDAAAVVCYEAADTLLQSPRYLTPDGELSREFRAFGHAAYSFTSSPDGTLWIGTKPDGLYRLTPRTPSSYEVLHLCHQPSSATLSDDNIYDLRYDDRGRLWVGTMGGGIDCLPTPHEAVPHVVRLGATQYYPEGALSVRRLQVVGDTLLLAATTGGLVVAPLPGVDVATDFRPRLYDSQPEQRTSLGCPALMDVLTTRSSRTFVATESDGVNLLCGLPSTVDTAWQFCRLDDAAHRTSDVALALSLDSAEHVLRVVSNNSVYEVSLDSQHINTYGPTFWHRKLRFCDASPLAMPDGRWLYAVEDGAVLVDATEQRDERCSSSPCFTSVTIAHRPDSLLSSACRTLQLGATERDVTLHLAAPGAIGDVAYTSRIDRGVWMSLGGATTLSLVGLRPGQHQLEVRIEGADAPGCTLWLEVSPAWWETVWARLLGLLLTLALMAGGVSLTGYVRALRRKQRATMAAYLGLLSARTEAGTPAQADAPEPPAAPRTAAEERFMQQVADYMAANMGSTTLSIDDLALATATSRSVLNRRMKQMFGMTPAEFIRENRISRAATLLVTTDHPISDIAWECGFSDLNYFGKCFKAKYKITPSAYRSNGHHPQESL